MHDAEQNKAPTGANPPPLSERQRRLGHELRSAAQGLLGYINIFSDEMQSRLTPEEAVLMERIWHYGKKLSELSMELLNELQELSQRLSDREPE
ncbi:MAG TPA: hypothetical protein PKY55_03985 [bacterium]|nr:hypothetical protein [bacterium]HOY43248.1 hypothetical protein [bacterium]HPG82414.1 hypothetical protein [bacterium]HPM60107.1 hypothetical protein [bacterium]